MKGLIVISTSDFKKGFTKILWNNEPWVIVDYQLVKPGKGGTYLRTKMKNMISGRMLEETFRSAEKFPEPDLEYKEMQFLYADGQMYHFMDKETYEQIDLDAEHVVSVKKYLKDSEVYNVINFQGRPILVEPPIFMVLQIKDTVPGVKGDTAQGGSKPATLETGLVIQVPLFLNEGQKIKVDTREDKYIEKVD
jgi:elongation factor P